MTQPRNKKLTPRQKKVIAVAATAQLSLLMAALFDIWRRPAEQIKGPKRLWAAASFINFAGPISYFLFGRKPAAAPGAYGEAAPEAAAHPDGAHPNGRVTARP
ncbi:MAG: PLD nuclease N-terminal domain-containing protein [Micromonosporaceae bacterium]